MVKYLLTIVRFDILNMTQKKTGDVKLVPSYENNPNIDLSGRIVFLFIYIIDLHLNRRFCSLILSDSNTQSILSEKKKNTINF